MAKSSKSQKDEMDGVFFGNTQEDNLPERKRAGRKVPPAARAVSGEGRGPSGITAKLQERVSVQEQELTRLAQENDELKNTPPKFSQVMPVSGATVEFVYDEIDPDLIDVSEENERQQQFLDELSLGDVLPSIQEHQQQEPGKVRPKADGRFELILGSRRLACARLLGRPYKAMVGDVPDEDVRELALIENAQLDVSPFEKALAFKRMLENGEYKHWTELGERKGISSSHISRYRACAEMDPIFVQILNSPSDMHLAYGEKIAKLAKANPKALMACAKEILKEREIALEAKETYLSIKEILARLEKSVKDADTTAKPTVESHKMANGGRLKVSRGNNSAKLELAGLDKAAVEEVLAMVKAKLGIDC